MPLCWGQGPPRWICDVEAKRGKAMKLEKKSLMDVGAMTRKIEQIVEEM